MRFYSLSAWLVQVIATSWMIGSAHTYRSARYPSYVDQQHIDSFSLGSTMPEIGIAPQADGVAVQPLKARAISDVFDNAQFDSLGASGSNQQHNFKQEIRDVVKSLGHTKAIVSRHSLASVTYSMQVLKPGQYLQYNYPKSQWEGMEDTIRLYIALWGPFSQSFKFEFLKDQGIMRFRIACEKDPTSILSLFTEDSIDRQNVVDVETPNKLEDALKKLAAAKTITVKVSCDLLEVVSKNKTLCNYFMKFSVNFLKTPTSLYLRFKKNVTKKRIKVRLVEVGSFTGGEHEIKATSHLELERLAGSKFADLLPHKS
ncbi:hypothetical protein FA10DRAFT_257554 [Acaromyces ingoldii]|uniref:Uncharacterized protein n=1 Tax=Acaromyces ingoldii TaxID=215250 RepID=A0A316YZG9_9BASI|nr:hypothetical protein FA10DRAFT_257554 [Acaromyces ingoldii]PWN93215.1 hypothetical protein FA10DRAFT_257554 [Acaromyces ingoldii]